ncbi:hypothetical protein ACWGA9_28415 [Streptomyces sp. NPDC054950]
METTANASENAPTSHAPDPDALTPGQLLRQAKRLADEAARLLEQAVVAERIRGTSWETIGEVLGGVTKSAVHKRYGTFVHDWIERTVEFEDHPDGTYTQLPLWDDAYKELWAEWKRAAEIVAAQDLIAELSNATTAASGEGSGRRAITSSSLASVFIAGNAAAHVRPPWLSAWTDTPERSAAFVAGSAEARQRLEAAALTPQVRDALAAQTCSWTVEPVAQGDNPHVLAALEQRVAKLERFLAASMQEEPGHGADLDLEPDHGALDADVLPRQLAPVRNGRGSF